MTEQPVAVEMMLITIALGVLFSLSFAVMQFVMQGFSCNRREKEAALKRSAFSFRIAIGLSMVLVTLHLMIYQGLPVYFVTTTIYLIGMVIYMIMHELDAAEVDIIKLITWPFVLMFAIYKKLR